MNNNRKSMAAALGSALALSAGSALAADNPFAMVEFGEGVNVAANAVDMQGNKVMIEEETGFTYGGDQKASYAGGKIATGEKDPSVCGTYKSESCSVSHIPGSATYKK